MQESIISDAIKPMLKLVSSTTTSFPSGAVVRSVILYKIIDVLYVMGLRLGFELARQYMTSFLQLFFKPFEKVHSIGTLEGITPTGSSSDLMNGFASKGKTCGSSL